MKEDYAKFMDEMLPAPVNDGNRSSQEVFFSIKIVSEVLHQICVQTYGIAPRKMRILNT